MLKKVFFTGVFTGVLQNTSGRLLLLRNICNQKIRRFKKLLELRSLLVSYKIKNVQLKYSCIRLVLKTLKKQVSPHFTESPFLRTPFIFIENVTFFPFFLLFGHLIAFLNKGGGFQLCISVSERGQKQSSIGVL